MSENGNQNQAYVKAIVYDLGSENLTVFRGSSVFDMVRASRVRCVQVLHSLGVQCTESVILVSPNKVQKVDGAIQKVNQIYQQLNETLRANGFYVRLEPIIQVLDLTTSQADRLIPLATRRLLASLDRAIDHVSRILDDLEAITEVARLRRVKANLRRLQNQWNSVFEMARRLGIDLSRDYGQLVDLIDEALRRCR